MEMQHSGKGNIQSRVVSIGARAISSAVLLWLLISKTDTERIKELFLSMNVLVFIFCISLMIVVQMIAAYRWQIFVKADNPDVLKSALLKAELV